MVDCDLHAQLQYEVTPLELRYSRFWRLLDRSVKALSNSKDFQLWMVSTYNEDVSVPASVVIFPLYPHDKVSKKGSLLILTNALESTGFLYKAGDRHYRLGSFASNCRLILFGDMLTDDMMACVKERVISRLSNIGREEYVSVLNNAMEQSTHLNGMLHVKMHNLVVIYWIFYGAFLQAFQAKLRFKWIQQNLMKGSYKDHEVFGKLVFNALKKYWLEIWMHSTTAVDDVGLVGDDLLLKMETSFVTFCKAQLTSSDEMTRLAANFVKEFASFDCLDNAIRCGDTIVCEKEFLASIPRYKATNKFRYVNGAMRFAEVLYEQSLPQMLELICQNWSVVLNHGKGVIAQMTFVRRSISLDEIAALHSLL